MGSKEGRREGGWVGGREGVLTVIEFNTNGDVPARRGDPLVTPGERAWAA